MDPSMMGGAGAAGAAAAAAAAQNLVIVPRSVQVTQIVGICGFAIAVWDAIVCARSEYHKVWSQGKLGVRIMYFIARYYTIVSHIFILAVFNGKWTKSQCKVMIHAVPALSMVSVLACNGIFAARCFAIWKQNVRIGFILGTLFFITFFFMLFDSVAGITLAPYSFLGGAEKDACVPFQDPRYPWLVYFYYATPAVFDTVSTVLAVYKCWLIGKEFDGAQSKLLETFWKHGIICFLATTCINLANISMFAQKSSPDYQALLTDITVTLSSVFACRLLLALRSGSHIGHATSYTSHVPPYGVATKTGQEPNYNLPVMSSEHSNEKTYNNRDLDDISDDGNDAVYVSKETVTKVEHHV